MASKIKKYEPNKSFKKGEVITHKTFGEGEVLKTSKTNDDISYILVDFGEEYGKQKLVMKITKSEIFTEDTFSQLKKQIVTDEWLVKKGDILARLVADASGVIKFDYRKTNRIGKETSAPIKNILIFPGESHQIYEGAELKVKHGDLVSKGAILAKWGETSKKTIDIIQGLPRVEELFEIRNPNSKAIFSEIDGRVSIHDNTITIIPEEEDTVRWDKNGEIV